MCLIVAMLLFIFGINMIVSGDYIMGIGASLAALSFLTFMIRYLMRLKKEDGVIHAKDCFSCSTRK